MADVSKGTLKARRLKDFDFGYASASAEASNKPSLLLQGFVDRERIIEKAISAREFLFLGHKGSGKSALGEHIRLLAADNPQLFVKFIDIADMSFSTFSQILKDNRTEPEARYPTVWSWLLLLQLFDSFSKDQGSNITQDEDLFLAIEELRQLGLLPEPKLTETIRTTAEKSFSVKLAGVMGGGTKSTTAVNQDLPFFVDRLKLIAGRFRSESRHLLIVDGFDDLLRRGTLQFDALGSLIFEANRLNDEFSKTCTPAKIILLCRTDLFERLPGANKNKIRQDCAVHLNWYEDLHDLRQAALVQLINHRASLKSDSPVDVFEVFLPSTLFPNRPDDIRSQLLEQTRYVPRDIIVLFKKLQEYSGDGKMTPNQVFDALVAYSRDYFVPEIRDELDGYVDGQHISFILELFSNIGKTMVPLRELEDQATQLGPPGGFDLRNILRLLFDCSAIGNANPRAKKHSFKFGNRYASFNQSRTIMIHVGLWKGLNLRLLG